MAEGGHVAPSPPSSSSPQLLSLGGCFPPPSRPRCGLLPCPCWLLPSGPLSRSSPEKAGPLAGASSLTSAPWAPRRPWSGFSEVLELAPGRSAGRAAPPRPPGKVSRAAPSQPPAVPSQTFVALAASNCCCSCSGSPSG